MRKKGGNSRPRILKPGDFEDGKGNWIFDSCYAIEKHEPLIKRHFESGLTLTSLAGALGVTRRTIYNWMDKHEEFKACVQKYEELALLKTDQDHYDAAVGDKPKANGAAINLRANMILGFTQKNETKLTGEGLNIVITEKPAEDT